MANLNMSLIKNGERNYEKEMQSDYGKLVTLIHGNYKVRDKQ